MSNLWTFSPSSDVYLQRCIAAAPPPDPTNKWFQKFGKKTAIEPTESTKDKRIVEHKISEEKKDETVNYEDFFDAIMSESNIPVEYILVECTKNTDLVPILAEKITPHSVEQLFKDIFSRDDVESRFLPFITSFLPAFFKLNNSRLCTELLTRTSEYSHLFKELLETIINDTEAPKKVLNNYISSLNEQSATNFMKNLSQIEITEDGFLQNVFALYTAYKESNKDDLIQNYIKTLIIQHGNICASDRNFGRLFFLYLQAEKSLDRKVDTKVLEECLETHTSPFKRPCCNLLKEINSDSE